MNRDTMPTTKFDQAMTLLGLNHEDRGLHLVSVEMEAGRIHAKFAKVQSVSDINQQGELSDRITDAVDTLEAAAYERGYRAGRDADQVARALTGTGPGVLVMPDSMVEMVRSNGIHDITIPGVGRLRIPAGATVQFVPEEPDTKVQPTRRPPAGGSGEAKAR